MESMNQPAPKQRQWVPTLAFIVAYIASRVTFAVFDFHYSLFGERFDVRKLLIDFGVWIAAYFVVLWSLNRLVRR